MDPSSKSPFTVVGALVPARDDDAQLAVPRAVDMAIGTAAAGALLARAFVRRAEKAVVPVARPLAGLVLRPPLLHPRLHPATWLEAAARDGAGRRREVAHRLAGVLDVLVPIVLNQLLDRVDLTSLVLQRVDLDAVVAGVDLDAVASRIDIEAILNRLDLTLVVQERVDLDAIVAEVDIAAVLDRLDLTQVVLQRVDLEAIVDSLDLDAVVARVDIDKVIDRIDLVGISAEVIDAVDLPEIIRESTGGVASETVRGVRMRSIAGDEAIGRVVDRLLLRRRHRQTVTRGVVLSQPSEADDDSAAAEDSAAATGTGTVGGVAAESGTSVTSPAPAADAVPEAVEEIPGPREPGALGESPTPPNTGGR